MKNQNTSGTNSVESDSETVKTETVISRSSSKPLKNLKSDPLLLKLKY